MLKFPFKDFAPKIMCHEDDDQDEDSQEDVSTYEYIWMRSFDVVRV